MKSFYVILFELKNFEFVFKTSILIQNLSEQSVDTFIQFNSASTAMRW